MKHRYVDLMAETSYSADTTKILDIKMSELISLIMIELDVLGASDSATAHAIACLTKIELCDGSDVLWSLNGYEAEALDFYHHGWLRSNWNPYLNTLYCQRFIGLNFGRFLFDKQLAWDPTKFKNPQLKLTLDIDAGGNASTANKLHVWAAAFDRNSSSPIGFLMAKELKSKTMTASSHEYTKLPTDYPYRGLYIRNLEAGTEPNSNIANIKLSEDQDKRVLFNCPPNDIMRLNPRHNQQIIEQIMFAAKTATCSVFGTPSERSIAIAMNWATAVGTDTYASYGNAGGRMTIDAGADENACCIMAGYNPHGTYQVPFNHIDEPEEYYEPGKDMSVELDVTTGSGAAGTETCQVFIEQLRKYAA